MKLLKALISFAAAAAATLTVTSASAAVVCSGVEYAGDATFVGSLNTTTNDQCSFTNTAISDNNFAINNWWIFQITPAGEAAVNAVFIPDVGVLNFNVMMYSASSVTCGAIGATCTYTQGASTGAINNSGSGFVVNLPFTSLAAGYYVFNITGTSVEANASNLYSGNVTTRATPISEPSILALMGLALVGLGFLRRRA